MKRFSREDLLEALKRMATVTCPEIGAVQVVPGCQGRAPVWIFPGKDPDRAFLDEQLVEPRPGSAEKPLPYADLEALASRAG